MSRPGERGSLPRKGMFILGNVVLGLGQVLHYVLWLYACVLAARAVFSWVDADPRNRVVRLVAQMTDPPLRTIRRMLPVSLRTFPIDMAFVTLLALVVFADYAVAQSLVDLGIRIKGPGYLI